MPIRLLPLSILIVCCSIPIASDAHASTDWPGLRGPNYDGAVRDAQLFDGDEGALSVSWKRELGSGYPVVAVDGQRAVTLFSSGEDDLAAAFDIETGDVLWRYRINDIYKGHTGSHDGPIATPALVDGRVYGLGPRGDLFALDAETGNELWSVDLVEEMRAEAPFYGFGSSPVVVGGVLVVEIGAGAGKTVAGFDIENGSEMWTVGDDTISYHSPIVATIGGREQVVAIGRKTVMGLDPASGETLWSYDHNGDERAMGGETIVPVPAGEDRLLLLNTQPASTMLRITGKKRGKFEITELWSDKSISGTYVIPVYLDGYLYGMTGKIFTCVDAATGETQWKSRGPGDGFPTLVGGQLAIMTKPGTLIIANADPKGYEEVTRLDLFEEHSWSAPAFANGSLYVRSMSEIARVDLDRAQTVATTTASWIQNTAFGLFLKEVENADDKVSVIDDYLDRQSTFPIVEPDGSVHFVYRGEAEDVGIVGDMIGFRREDPMIQVADTDLFYYSTRLEPDAGVNYGFLVNYGEPTADSLNPQPGDGLFGEVSWLAMPGWQGPDHLGEVEASRQGRLEAIEWESTVREGQTRPAQVYLPAGYDDDPDRRYPVLYVIRGGEALEKGFFKNTLDNLIGETIEPVIAVMVISIGEVPRADIGDEDSYIEMITTELVPMIDERYRTLADSMSRGVASTGSGADVALNAAFRHPEIFGRVGAIWPGLFDYDFSVIPNADEHPLVIYQGWGTYHLRSPHESFDSTVDNRRLREALRDAGYRPAGTEVPEGIGWTVYRGYTDDMLRALYPLR